MNRQFAPFLLAAMLGAAPALAQEDTTMSLGEDVAEQQIYVAETFQDWQLRCTRVEDGDDRCQMYQLMQDAEGNSVAEVTLFPLAGDGVVEAGATIATPLETLLSQQVTLRIDGGLAKRYPFTFCNATGCFSRIGFTGDEVAQFKSGNAATVSIVPLAATDRVVTVTMSLNGFTAAYDKLSEGAAGE